MKKISSFFITSLALFFSLGHPALFIRARAQAPETDNFFIHHIEANEKEKAIKLYIVARDGRGNDLVEDDSVSWFKAYIRKGESAASPLFVDDVAPVAPAGKVGKKGEASPNKNIKVLFLLDLSGSMRENNKLVQAKEAIKKALESGLLDGIQSEFSYFNSDIGPSSYLSKENFYNVVDPVDVRPPGPLSRTDLHRAIMEKTEDLAAFPGEKALILLTDGKNETSGNPKYEGPNALRKITEYEVLNHIRQLDSTFLIFPVGIGRNADEQFLKAIGEATKNQRDYYRFGVAPAEIGGTFLKVVGGLQPNFFIKLLPDESDAIFRTELRTFTLEYRDNKGRTLNASKGRVFGSSTKEIDLRKNPPTDPGKISALLIGLIFVGLLLLVLMYAIPLHNNYKLKKHIFKYYKVKVANVVKKDPLTLMPFKDNDDVVAMGDKLMLVDTWKYLKEKGESSTVKDHAEFFQYHSSGSFFSQKGAFQRLNWLWFGALGGFTVWLLEWVFESFSFPGYRELLSRLFDTLQNEISEPIYHKTFLGFCMGFAMVSGLAFVEEFGQSRNFSIWRILQRILIGAFLGVIVFFLESILVAKFLQIDYIGGLIGWTIFGTAIGFVVTINSSIEPVNGVQGGLLAGVLGFHFYYLFGLPFMNNFFSPELARLLSFILYGGALGFILFTVVSRLEDFELLYLSPKSFSGQVKAISKWLKSPNIECIFIGTSPECEVYVKWHDKEVAAQHARMSLVRNVVYIESCQGCETFVNNALIQKKTTLANGDKIKFGPGGETMFQFIAKEKSDKSRGQKGQSAQSGINPPGGPKPPSKKNLEIRKKIKIYKRNPHNS